MAGSKADRVSTKKGSADDLPVYKKKRVNRRYQRNQPAVDLVLCKSRLSATLRLLDQLEPFRLLVAGLEHRFLTEVLISS